MKQSATRHSRHLIRDDVVGIEVFESMLPMKGMYEKMYRRSWVSQASKESVGSCDVPARWSHGCLVAEVKASGL